MGVFCALREKLVVRPVGVSIFFVSILLLFVFKGHAQVSYAVKAEAGFLKYQNNTIQVDPGPNWKGYYLYDQNGVGINFVQGLDYKDKLFAGIGAGYLNFEGVNGASVFSDFEYLPFKTRLTPLINLRIGYSHVWNQYENGSGTAMGEICMGLNVRLNQKIDMYCKSGILVTQQALFMPFRFGIGL
jgi:hypothetical protein